MHCEAPQLFDHSDHAAPCHSDRARRSAARLRASGRKPEHMSRIMPHQGVLLKTFSRLARLHRSAIPLSLTRHPELRGRALVRPEG